MSQSLRGLSPVPEQEIPLTRQPNSVFVGQTVQPSSKPDVYEHFIGPLVLTFVSICVSIVPRSQSYLGSIGTPTWPHISYLRSRVPCLIEWYRQRCHRLCSHPGYVGVSDSDLEHPRILHRRRGSNSIHVPIFFTTEERISQSCRWWRPPSPKIPTRKGKDSKRSPLLIDYGVTVLYDHRRHFVQWHWCHQDDTPSMVPEVETSICRGPHNLYD